MFAFAAAAPQTPAWLLVTILIVFLFLGALFVSLRSWARLPRQVTISTQADLDSPLRMTVMKQTQTIKVDPTSAAGKELMDAIARKDYDTVRRLAASIASPTSDPPSSVADELIKLDQLRQSGALTQAEFDTEKARLLGES